MAMMAAHQTLTTSASQQQHHLHTGVNTLQMPSASSPATQNPRHSAPFTSMDKAGGAHSSRAVAMKGHEESGTTAKNAATDASRAQMS